MRGKAEADEMNDPEHRITPAHAGKRSVYFASM